MIKRFWTTFKTLAEIESECKYGRLCMGDCYKNAHFIDLLFIRPPYLGHKQFISNQHTQTF